MSEALDQVVAKAMNDKQYRKLLLRNPDKALEGYAVTDDERQMLEGLTDETFDQFAGGLGDRNTQGQWIIGAG